MMSVVLLRFAAALYAIAAGHYLAHFARPRFVRAVSLGTGFLGSAFLLHAAAIGFACREFGGAEFFTPRGGLVMLAWVMAGALLLLHRYIRLPSVAAFVTPIILALLLAPLFGAPGRVGGPPQVVRIGLLRVVHIPSAFLGLALFATAFGVAIMYLLQEREVKGKHFGALFSRLPSLDALDRLNQGLVRTGFLVFTLTLVTGAVVAKTAWGRFWEWDPHQVAVLLVWLLYGGMVQLHRAGWHGRRYALLTVLGFVLVFGSFVVFSSVPELSRHRGDYL